MSAEVEGSAILFLGLDCPPFGAGEVVEVDGLELFCAGLSSIEATILLDFFFLVIMLLLSHVD